MNSKDFAMLNKEQVLERMQKNTGLSLEELQGTHDALSMIAKTRLDAIGLTYPVPKVLGIYSLQKGIAGCSYMVKRSLSAKGFTNSRSTIIYQIIDSIAIYDDLLWYHVSVVRGDGKMPTYDDLCWVKQGWIGSDRTAIQVFPKVGEHVNDHPHCLHLWSCLEEGFKLPDFRVFGTI